MSQYKLTILALFMIGCGPTTEHESGTCSGSAGIHQTGSYIPYPITDAGHGDTQEPTADAGVPVSDAGLTLSDTQTPGDTD